MREVVIGHRLSEAQPKPMTMKSCGGVRASWWKNEPDNRET